MWHTVWIAGSAAAALVVGLAILLRRKGARPGLEIKVESCRVEATRSERGDWAVRVQAALANRTTRSVSVTVVAFRVEKPDGTRLGPNCVTGDKTRVVKQRGHGPDLAMRLPIALRQKASSDFTFDIFFPHTLERFFGKGVLVMEAGTECGLGFQALTPLSHPER